MSKIPSPKEDEKEKGSKKPKPNSLRRRRKGTSLSLGKTALKIKTDKRERGQHLSPDQEGGKRNAQEVFQERK